MSTYIVTVVVSSPLAVMSEQDRAEMLEGIREGVEDAGCSVFEISAEEVTE